MEQLGHNYNSFIHYATTPAPLCSENKTVYPLPHVPTQKPQPQDLALFTPRGWDPTLGHFKRTNCQMQ